VRSILRIETTDGTALYQAPSPSPQQVISAQAAYMITSVLSDNQAREADFNVTNPLTNDSTTGVFAAKTGTSQGTTGPKDIITVGYSPYLVVGAWVGNANGDDLKSNIIGISGAGYIFSDMLQWAHDNYKWPNEQFPIPPDMARGQFNCVTGLAPYAGTTPGQCQLQPFKPGSTALYFGYNGNYSGLRMDEDWYIQGQQWLQS
jgi:membrane peptidoglycan carboxypeptidase